MVRVSNGLSNDGPSRCPLDIMVYVFFFFGFTSGSSL